MVVYRHKIWLKNIRRSFADGDFENIKMVALFVATLGIMTFFSVKIVDTLNQGIEAEKRTQTIQVQVQQLEKENQLLHSQKGLATSDTEIEAQYRALGHKKPGESVYIVNKQEDSSLESVDTSTQQQNQNLPEEPNWQKWFLFIFKK